MPTLDRMLSAEAEYVLRTVEERGIRFVRLWFTDVLGFLKSFTITSQELEGALTEGMGFDGSSIEGFSRIQESDMVALPGPLDVPDHPVEDRAARGADVLRHHAARRHAVRRRPAAGAQAPARSAPPTSATRSTSGPELEYFYFQVARGPDVPRSRRVLRRDAARRRHRLPQAHRPVPRGDGHPGRVRRTTRWRRPSTRSTCATRTR